MSNQRIESSLSAGRFERRQLASRERQHILASFGDHIWARDACERWRPGGSERLVDQVLGCLGDGKEATVYLCALDDSQGGGMAVAKVYRSPKFRAFDATHLYLDEQHLRDRRARHAIRRRTRFGRRASHAAWIEREWETLCRLHDAGVCVPAPLARTSDAILMEFLGDAEEAAPRLEACRLEGHECRQAFKELLGNVALMLACDRVHGDLSAYNVLWWNGRATIIDLPQAVEAGAPCARALLERDVFNLCHYFDACGLPSDPEALADEIWWSSGAQA